MHDATRARFDQMTAVSEKSGEATPIRRQEAYLKNELEDEFQEMKSVVQGE